MPKASPSTVSWSFTQQCYELSMEHGERHCLSPHEYDRWSSWLESRMSFSFQGQSGHLSLLKELRARGGGYWYAYRSHDGKTVKKYLGRTASLTLERLEDMARVLNSPTDKQPSPGSQKKMHPEMIRSLLLAKLRLPRSRSFLLPRAHLLARLDKGLERHLTLVLAPAGSGKSTLVSSWAARHLQQNGTPVAWLSLDTGDNDPIRFWRYLIAACEALYPTLTHASHALAHAGREGALNRDQALFVVTALLNELHSISKRAVLVLEDYHEISSPVIHQSLATFIDHLPPTLHVVLITRHDPPLPLARLRASQELSELLLDDLRFSVEETETFLTQALSIPLPPGAARRLTERTEGWAVGVQLAMLVLQGKSDPMDIERVLATFSGGHRHVLEYLLAEVLAAQPPAVQTFLLRTSFLNRLTASLCDAMTEGSQSELLLNHLARSHLFLVPLDDAEQWYRYHSLFAEAMRLEAHRRFEPDVLLALALTASRWYEAHDMLTEAIECALSAGAFAYAAPLIEHYAAGAFHFHSVEEVSTLLRWLEALPHSVLHTRPSLCFAQAMMLLFRLDSRSPSTQALVEAPLQMAEQLWRAEENHLNLGMVLAFRSLVVGWQGDLSLAYALSHQALALLPPQEMQWRGIALLHLGKEAFLMGQLDEARRLFTEGNSCCIAVQNTFALLAINIALGNVCFAQGELQQAQRYYQRVPQLIAEKWHNHHEAGQAAHDDRALALIGLAHLSYEWNDLDAAEQQATQGLALATQLHEEHISLPATLLLARIWLARGDTARAQQLVQEQRSTVSSPSLLHSVLLEQAWLDLVGGELEHAQQTLASCLQQNGYVTHLEEEHHALLVARLLIAQGQAREALASLQPWLTEAHAMGRTRSELQLLSSMALAHLADGALSQAQHVLLQAATLAFPAGHCRIFLDAGEQMLPLLRKTLPIVSDEPLHSYLRSLLLATFGSSSSYTPVASSLSPQELRVLRLLVTGYSRTEIARELVVSINTVKTQLHSIYRKLNVTSRKEAYTAASRMHML